MTALIPLLLLAASATAGTTERETAEVPPAEPAASDEATGPDQATVTADTVEPDLPEGVTQIVHRAGEIEWGPCPPGPLSDLDCKMAVLEGNPRESALFTFRVASGEPFTLPPHTHPRHERVTVLEGAVHVGFGETLDKQSGNRFEAGDFYVNKAGAAHYVWSEGSVVLQLTGIGPWQIHPVGGAAATE